MSTQNKQQNQNNKDNEIYKKSESVILNLEILSTQYNNLLIQYKQAVADYINFLNHTNISDKTLTNISGQAFWGTGQAGTQAAYTNITNVNQCAALCLKTSKCTGATFNPTNYGKPMCWLRTGDGDTIPSKPNDYAIIPQAKMMLSNIKNINNKLTSVNNQILDKIKNSNSLYSEQYNERSQKASILLDNYKNLNKERVKIEKMINDYEDLDAEQIQGSLKVNSNYYSFLLLFALSIAILLLLYKFPNTSSNNSQSNGYFQRGGDGVLGQNFYYILLCIILLAIFIYYYWFIYMYTTGVISTISTFLYNTFAF